MLILSTVFMLIAVVAMLIEAGRWAPDYWNTRTAQPSVMHIEADAGSLFRG
ncbi:hypothetical protein [Crateriforma conspicua]|nr:hypothetical protein [Crateriforma conspicua]